MRKILISLAILSLTACTTVEIMNEKLSAYLDRPVAVLIDKIGYPDQTQIVAGKKVYFWSKTESSGSTSYRGFGFFKTSHTTISNYTCRIVVEVDEKEIIKKYNTDKFHTEVCFNYVNRLSK